MLGDWEKLMYPSCVTAAYDIYYDIERRRHAGDEIFPEQQDIFKALLLTPPDKVKVVILGQDPYSGVFQANGLAFSSTDKVKIPQSLKNIYTELEEDLHIQIPTHGDLTKWAQSGVLLLNTILTVQHGYPMSHNSLGWQIVTREILNVCVDLPQPIVFIGWGSNAIREISCIDLQGKTNKFRIFSSHPSPLGADKECNGAQPFKGSRPFSFTNILLQNAGSPPVDWSLL